MSKDERGRPTRRGEPFLQEPEAKPFWEGTREHKLKAQRCASCKKIFGFPPQSHCPHCLSSEFQWETLSGKGTVYSHIAYHRSWHPAYQDKIPYNVSLVDLAEGGRMVTNVIDCAPEDVKCGMPVEVVFEDREEFTLPKFRPAK